ncbi:MAG: ABC transporter ATP-binding protein [bacterium]
MNVVELQGVTKEYRLGQTTVPALRGVTLTVASGEFAAVWGPSGSGKSTLLNLIGAIDAPTTGTVKLGGQDLAALDDDRRSELRNKTIGFVFQNFNLVAVLSALENVMLPLQIGGMGASEARARAMGCLEEVELAPFTHHRPDQLSGGQRQRVSIARALATRPALVIADEPTANLDSDTALKIVDLMRDLNRGDRTTFLFSTHDQRLLDHVDRRIELVDGLLKGEPS